MGNTIFFTYIQNIRLHLPQFTPDITSDTVSFFFDCGILEKKDMFGWSEIWGHILSNVRSFAESAKWAQPGNMFRSLGRAFGHIYSISIQQKKKGSLPTRRQNIIEPMAMYISYISVVFHSQNDSLLKPLFAWHVDIADVWCICWGVFTLAISLLLADNKNVVSHYIFPMKMCNFVVWV